MGCEASLCRGGIECGTEPERASEGWSCGADWGGGAVLLELELEKGHQLIVRVVCACATLSRKRVFVRLSCTDDFEAGCW